MTPRGGAGRRGALFRSFRPGLGLEGRSGLPSLAPPRRRALHADERRGSARASPLIEQRGMRGGAERAAFEVLRSGGDIYCGADTDTTRIFSSFPPKFPLDADGFSAR